jgi:hypothetical protein
LSSQRRVEGLSRTFSPMHAVGWELGLDGQPTQLPPFTITATTGGAELHCEPPILKQLNYVLIVNTKIS